MDARECNEPTIGDRLALLLAHPIAVRKGERLFDEGDTTVPLELIKSETFRTGVLYLVYRPAKATADASYDEAKTHLPQDEQ
jgi:hypothetical protein